MIWLVTKNSSHQIVSCNLHQEGDKHSLWVGRQNGKNLKVIESTDLVEVQEYKRMIDYAIKNNHSTLELDI